MQKFRQLLTYLLLLSAPAVAQVSNKPLSELSGKTIKVSSTAADDVTTGQWYLLSQRTRSSYVFVNTAENKLKHTKTQPSGSARVNANYLVRLISSSEANKYYLQDGYGNYYSTLCDGNARVGGKNNGVSATPTTYTVQKINNTNGHFYLQDPNNVIMDGDDPGSGIANVAGWTTSVPQTTGGNNDWAFYSVDLEESTSQALVEEYLTFGGAFRIRCRETYNSTNEYITLSNDKRLTVSPKAASGMSQIWLIDKQGNSYTLRNPETGLAIPSDVSGGTVATKQAGTFYIKYSASNQNPATDQYITISIKDDYSGQSCLHHQNYGHVLVKWYTGATDGNYASDWIFEPVEDYTMSELKEAVNTALGRSTSVTSGKKYRIINENYGSIMAENLSNNILNCTAYDATNYNALWTLTTSDGNVKLQNAVTDRYPVKQGGTRSVQYQTGESETSFTLKKNEGTWYDTFSFVDAGSVGLHCDASARIVGWWTDAVATHWYLEEVTLTEYQLAELDAARNIYHGNLDINANAATYNQELSNFFTDLSCSELKSDYLDYSDEQLRNAMEALPIAVQNMAIKVKNNSWRTDDASWDKTEKTFRIASYKAYGDYGKWTSIIKQGYSLGRLTNPTGISGDYGTMLLIYVGAIPAGHTVALEAVGAGSAAGTQYPLSEGINSVLLDNSCTLFIYHSVDNTSGGNAPFTDIDSYDPVTIHIEGGFVNGYFDLTKGDDNDDWAKFQTYMAIGDMFDMKTEHLTFHIDRAKLFAAEPTNITGLLGIWENMMQMERSLQGLEEYDGYFNNPLSVTSINSNYMYASTYGTYYELSTLATVLNYNKMHTSSGANWGPAHEMGHIHQYPINMIGCTEVSNNVFSNVAVYNLGYHTSRSASIQKTIQDFHNGVSWLDRVFNSSEKADLWQATHLYWQLYQYFHIAGYKTDFYPALYKALRQSPMTHTGGVFIPASEDYLKFYKTCCEVSGYDLTEFFQVYGFFMVPTQSSYTLGGTTRDAHRVGDYGNYYVYATQEMIDAVKAEVKAMKLKPCNMIFIEDRIYAPDATYDGAAAGAKKVSWDANDATYGAIGSCGETGQYSDFSTPISGDYSATVDGEGNVTISGGTGAVGFKVYDAAGNLAFVANTHNFTLPATLLAQNYTIKVAQGDGSSAVITPLYKNVRFNYSPDGFFTTIYSPVALKVPSGATAYAGKVEGENLVLSPYDGIIPAMQGALVEFKENPYGGTSAFTIDFDTSSEAGTAIAGNSLMGSLVDADPRTQPGEVYTFAMKDNVVGFYKYTGSLLKAGKAFLLLSPEEALNIRGFVIERPTGIATTWQPNNIRSGSYYDLQGRKLLNEELPKGLYIINGKKVIR